MKNIAIIYHDADFDGKLSNEVCRFHLKRLHPEANIHSYGWDYGRETPDVSQIRVHDGYCNDGEPVFLFGWDAYDAIYIVDLSVDELMAKTELRDRIVWIDHHKHRGRGGREGLSKAGDRLHNGLTANQGRQ